MTVRIGSRTTSIERIGVNNFANTLAKEGPATVEVLTDDILDTDGRFHIYVYIETWWGSDEEMMIRSRIIIKILELLNRYQMKREYTVTLHQWTIKELLHGVVRYSVVFHGPSPFHVDFLHAQISEAIARRELVHSS